MPEIRSENYPNLVIDTDKMIVTDEEGNRLGHITEIDHNHLTGVTDIVYKLYEQNPPNYSNQTIE